MFRNFKIASMWVIGAFFFLLASMIAGNTHPGLGVDASGIAIALLVAFVLFLLAGIMWISVAVASKHPHEV